MSGRKDTKRTPAPASAPTANGDGELAVYGRILFTVALSPVQKFIGAARRMRDLAYGSQLLDELSSILALHLQDTHGARLIFPAPAQAPSAAGRLIGTHKIVCLLPARCGPAGVAGVASDLQERLRSELLELGQRCLDMIGPRDQNAVLADAFLAQMTGSLRLFHAWSKVRSGDAEGYAQAYRLAQQMLDARKRVRDFDPPGARPGWQLSSLDGERDSVLADGHLPLALLRNAVSPDQKAAAKRLRSRFQIDLDEQLDAMGLVKRVLGTESRFPALVRVAVQPWVARWAHDQGDTEATAPARQRLTKLQALFEQLAAHGLAQRNRVASGPMATLPFDGDLLLAPRRALERRAQQERASAAADPNAAEHQAATAALGLIDQLDELLKDEPGLAQAGGISGTEESLYVAMLVADGDHLGSRILDLAATATPPAKLHRQLASALSTLADAAIATVSQHGGHALFAGGDDLLAVLPVQSALTCAEVLRQQYAAGLAKVLPEKFAAQRANATLSIGIAIGHVNEPMGRLLARAHAACKAAKQGPGGHGLRNALGLEVKPRAGAAVSLQRRWQDEAATAGQPDPSPLVARLESWRDAFAAGQVSASLPYDLKRTIEDEPRQVVPAACRRLFERRGIDKGILLDDMLAQWDHWTGPCQLSAPRAAEAMARDLYLCRWLAAQPRPAPPVAATGTPTQQQE